MMVDLINHSYHPKNETKFLFNCGTIIKLAIGKKISKHADNNMIKHRKFS